MKQNGGLLRAIGRLRINFWLAMLLCVLCVGVTYGGTGTTEELMGAGARVCAGTVRELGRILLGR